MSDSFVELAVAILAIAVENDEIFNVDKKIAEDIVASMKLNKTWPVIKVYEDDSRLKYGVELVKIEEI